MRCLVATLGKDAPGVNAVIRAGTRLALRQDMQVYGAKRGFLGILNEQFFKMKESNVGSILGKGGSYLGSSDFRIHSDDRKTYSQITQALKQFDLVIATGGLGSFAILNRVYDHPYQIGLTTTMFVPASVENEFLDPCPPGEESTVHAEAVGADTAANTAVQAVDRLREQSYLNDTVFLVEVLGLKSNWLPLQIGAACGAHRVYLPRFPVLSEEQKKEIRAFFGAGFDPNQINGRELAEWIETMFREGKRSYVVVVVPNGIPLINPTAARSNGGDTDSKYADIVTSMAPLELTVLRLVDDLSMYFANHSVQIRYVVIDDLQRGGTPSLRDRMLGSLYGEAAVEEFLAMRNAGELDRRGNLYLLSNTDTSKLSWRCIPKEEVTPLFIGDNPRAGGLDPLPFFRSMRGTVSGYRPWALA